MGQATLDYWLGEFVSYHTRYNNKWKEDKCGRETGQYISLISKSK